MELTKGQVVRAKAGRDKGGFFVVLEVENGYAWICNGKSRPLERPKRKNVIHLSPTKTVVPAESMVTNREIRKVLSAFGENLQ